MEQQSEADPFVIGAYELIGTWVDGPEPDSSPDELMESIRTVLEGILDTNRRFLPGAHRRLLRRLAKDAWPVGTTHSSKEEAAQPSNHPEGPTIAPVNALPSPRPGQF